MNAPPRSVVLLFSALTPASAEAQGPCGWLGGGEVTLRLTRTGSSARPRGPRPRPRAPGSPDRPHPAEQRVHEGGVVRHDVRREVEEAVRGGGVEQQQVGEGLGGEGGWGRGGGGGRRGTAWLVYRFYEAVWWATPLQDYGRTGWGWVFEVRFVGAWRLAPVKAGGEAVTYLDAPPGPSPPPPPPRSSRWLSFRKPPAGSDPIPASAPLWRVTGSSSSSHLAGQGPVRGGRAGGRADDQVGALSGGGAARR